MASWAAKAALAESETKAALARPRDVLDSDNRPPAALRGEATRPQMRRVPSVEAFAYPPHTLLYFGLHFFLLSPFNSFIYQNFIKYIGERDINKVFFIPSPQNFHVNQC